jgi:hypothetical protein
MHGSAGLTVSSAGKIVALDHSRLLLLPWGERLCPVDYMICVAM